MTESIPLTILFADIAGSTRLYDELGDAAAYDKVVQCLTRMKSLVESNQGKVIETIGDEIMCSFEDANQAIIASSEIQESFQPEMANGMAVRIGMHSGLTGMDNGHPFGDVVNVASRMASLATSGQIVFSRDSFEQLSASHQDNTRPFGRVSVKGKAKPIDTFELVWDEGDSTSLFSGSIINATRTEPVSKAQLILDFNGETLTFDGTGPSISVGRSDQNHFSIKSHNASRNHGIIQLKHGQITYTDHSTNGSYIKTIPGKRAGDGLDFFLHRDDWTMASEGIICLGEPVGENEAKQIRFKCSVR